MEYKSIRREFPRVVGVTMDEIYRQRDKERTTTAEELFGAVDPRTVGQGEPAPPSPVQKHRYCQAITRAGNDCSAYPVKGEPFCNGHLKSLESKE